MDVLVKSIRLDPPPLGNRIFTKIGDRIGKILRRKNKKGAGDKNQKKDERTVLISLKTNIFGLFAVQGRLPNGSYTVRSQDPEKKYVFTSKFVVLKGYYVPDLWFVGYTQEDREALNKKYGEMKEKAASTESKEEPEASKTNNVNVVEGEYKVTSETRSPGGENEPATVEVKASTKASDAKPGEDTQHSTQKVPKVSHTDSRMFDETGQPNNQHRAELERLWNSQRTAENTLRNTSAAAAVSESERASQPSSVAPQTLSPSRPPQPNRPQGGAGGIRPPFFGNRNKRKAPIPAANPGQEISGAINTLAKPVTSQLKKILIGVAIVVVIVVILFTFFQDQFGGGSGDGGGGNGGNNSTQPPPTTTGPGGGTGGSCPSTAGNSDPNTCHYLSPSIDLFATNISQDSINTYVEKYSPIFVAAGKGDKNEFISRVNYIVSDAQQAGLNPVLFLGYWKSESMFGTSPGADELGCRGGKTFEDQVDCAVGVNKGSDAQNYPIPNCARSRDANSPGCVALKAIRTGHPGQNDFAYPISYPISTFDDFAEAHGSFSDNPDGRKGNCTSTYNVLIEVATELKACGGSSTPPGPQVAASCPIPNGTITCGSLATPIAGCGHCNPQYRHDYPRVNCDAYPQTGYAMDIAGKDFQDVILPTISGHQITWDFVREEDKNSNEAIKGFAGEDTVTHDKFYLQLHHVDPGGSPGARYHSGDVGAKICGNGCGEGHVHVELGTGGTSLGNVTWADAPKFFCVPGV